MFYNDNVLLISNSISIDLGSETTIVKGYAYFVIQAIGGQVTVKTIEVTYSCFGIVANQILPKIMITTDVDQHGHHLPIDSRIDHTNLHLHIDDAINEEHAIALEDALECQVNIRGNSTSSKPKNHIVLS